MLDVNNIYKQDRNMDKKYCKIKYGKDTETQDKASNHHSTSFPGGLDSYPALTDNVDDVVAAHPNDRGDAIEALEAKVGVDSSAVVTSIDYFLKHASGAYRIHKHDGTSDDGASTLTPDEIQLGAGKYIKFGGEAQLYKKSGGDSRCLSLKSIGTNVDTKLLIEPSDYPTGGDTALHLYHDRNIGVSQRFLGFGASHGVPEMLIVTAAVSGTVLPLVFKTEDGATVTESFRIKPDADIQIASARGLFFGTDVKLIHGAPSYSLAIAGSPPTGSYVRLQFKVGATESTALALKNQATIDHFSGIPGAGFHYYLFEDSASGVNKEVRIYGYPSGASANDYARLQIIGINNDFEVATNNASGDIILSPGAGVGIGKAPSYLLDLNLTTEDFAIEDAGSTGATQQDWVEVRVGGVQGYLHVFAAK